MDDCVLPTNQRPAGTKGQHTPHATTNNAPPAEVAAPFVACQVIASEQKATDEGNWKRMHQWGPVSVRGLITCPNQHS
jgi:hypothetical protein